MMMFKHSLMLLCMVLLFSCIKDTPSSPEGPQDSQDGILDLEVPDGFNYGVTSTVNFNFLLLDSAGNAAKSAILEIYGIADNEKSGAIYTGLSNDNGKVETTLEVPNHFQTLLITTLFKNELNNFDYDLQPNIVDQLTVEGFDFSSAADDRALNCYPTVSTYFSDNNRICSVTSTKSVMSVQLFYTNGSNKTFVNPGGSHRYYTSHPEICDDGIDNDGDGLIDCADPECGIDEANCNGSLPCMEGFFQIVGKDLKQLNPVDGTYSTIGTLPSSINTYNGGGYNQEDGFIYCTGKVTSTGKIYLIRLYSNANITNLGELVGFEGRSYTGDIDDEGLWTNFYYNNGGWHTSTVDVSESPPTFVTTPAAASSVGDVNFYDWVYNKVCDKFYTLTQHGAELLVADHNANPTTITSIASYSGLPNGAYGAAWTDDEGDIYFSNNGTGKIYKVDLDNACSPLSITHVFTGAATSNNDGMSCTDAPPLAFYDTDTDGDNFTDDAEIEAMSAVHDPCNPLLSAAACLGDLAFGFSGGDTTGLEIEYIKCTFGCDAPIEYACFFNANIASDNDNDLVPNATDPDPLDPNKTLVQYRPSQNSYGTYAFEDLWPRVGDYDFNDFVMQVKEVIATNGSSDVYQVVYHLRIMAMGGIFNNNFGIVVPDPGDNAVVTVTSPHNVTHETEQRGNHEAITILKPKQLFYSLDIINADNGAPYFDPIEIQVKVEVNGDYKYPAGYTPTFFIEQHGVDGHEIHLPGVAPTPNMKPGLLGSDQDDSDENQSKYFLTITNLPWGLYVPKEWEYPQEGIPLTSAYLQFSTYAQSNPSLPWYQNNPGYIESDSTYTQH